MNKTLRSCRRKSVGSDLLAEHAMKKFQMEKRGAILAMQRATEAQTLLHHKNLERNKNPKQKMQIRRKKKIHGLTSMTSSQRMQ